jgi:aminoglycoside 3-N-acetyltransferase
MILMERGVCVMAGRLFRYIFIIIIMKGFLLNMSLDKLEIIQGLRELGIKSGSDILVHSSLASLGIVEGGTDSVIDALLEVIGSAGTLLMPAFGISQPFNIEKTPTGLGIIPETFRRRLGVVRSRNPLSSVVALGRRAEEYVRGHEEADCPFTQGTPYLRLAQNDGYILLLGVDQDRNTTLHTVEALAEVSYTTNQKGQWIDEKGGVQEKEYHRFAGPHRNFIGVDKMLREAGICRIGKIGPCIVRLMKSKELIDFLVPKVRKNPNLFLSESQDYWDGVWQRGKNHKALLEKTGFRFALRSSDAGSNLAEVLWQAEELGIHGLELDVVDGKDLSDFDTDDLEYLHRVFKKRSFIIETIRCQNAGLPAFERYLHAGKSLGASRVIVPLVGTIETLKTRAQLAKEMRLRFTVENIRTSSSEVAEMFKALGPDVDLAFNPAEFARVGELPFLKSYQNKVIKKSLACLTMNDVTHQNTPQLPGLGRAELAEILSILHCRSFNGVVVLSHSSRAGTFKQTADAFWALLERAGIL